MWVPGRNPPTSGCGPWVQKWTRPPPVCGPSMKPAYRAGVEGDDNDKGRLRLVVADDVPRDLAPGRVAHHALADHHVPRDAMQASNK